MSIWYDGTNLNMYRGDTGDIVFKGLPTSNNYRLYFSAKNISTNEIIFDISGDPQIYWVDEEGETYVRRDGETEEQFIRRMEDLEEQGLAFRKAKVVLFLPSYQSEKLSVLKGKDQAEYYYGVKICYTDDKAEDTLIPKVKVDPTTKKPIFGEPPKIIVKQKYSEGTKSLIDYDIDLEAENNPKDYGLQPLMTQGKGINIDSNNVISLDNSFSLEMELTNLADGDILVYNKSKGKWVNKKLTDLIG